MKHRRASEANVDLGSKRANRLAVRTCCKLHVYMSNHHPST
jgi:hypothetical protein